MKYINKKFSVYMTGDESYEKNYDKIFKKSTTSDNKAIKLKTIWVASVRDKDGCYVPVLAAKTKDAVFQALEKFKEKSKNNKYWDFSHPPLIVSVNFVEEEGK